MERIHKKEFLSKNWGYEPILIPHIENNLVSDKIRIPYELILVDMDTLKRIPKSIGFFTISDCKKEAERLKIKEDKYTILKHFRIRINFENIGSTFIKNFKMFINMIEPIIELPNKTMIDSIELLPSSKTGCEVDLAFETNDIIPDILKFEVCINYIDANTNYNERKIPVIYNFNENCWFYSRY